MKSWKNKEFVIFDVETTGLNPRAGDRIVEVAAIRIKNFKETERFEALINPQRPISEGAYKVNGISDDLLKDAPEAKEVIPLILKFLKKSPVIGHHIRFDLAFLSHECELCAISPLGEFCFIDTVKMARGLLPELEKYSLNNVANYLGYQQEQRHRAMSDVEMTMHVFEKLINLAESKGLGELEMILDLYGSEKKEKKKQSFKKERIQKAIDDKALLHVVYNGGQSGTTVRKITPKKLQGTGKETILVGFCHLRNEERMFKVNRIVHLENVVK